MWRFARNRDLEPGGSPRQHLSRRQQEARRAWRVLWAIGVLAALIIGTVIVSVAPKAHRDGLHASGLQALFAVDETSGRERL